MARGRFTRTSTRRHFCLGHQIGSSIIVHVAVAVAETGGIQDKKGGLVGSCLLGLNVRHGLGDLLLQALLLRTIRQVSQQE